MLLEICVLPVNFNSHAHVERDLFVQMLDSYRKDFNSHAHVERDHKTQHFLRSITISTHTLTWSVTLPNWQELNMKRFQLTRSRGA